MNSNKVKIGELFNLEKGSLQSSKCTPGKFNFITAAKSWKTHNDFDHECEALIIAVAASGSLGRTHYINGKFIASDLCFILTPKDSDKFPINLSFYHFVFNSMRKIIVTATKSGTSKESINQRNLKKYDLPYFNIERQNLWINKLKNTSKYKINLLDELTNQQSLLKKLRQQILQEAIEGKLTKDWRKENPDVEPASELLKKIDEEKENLFKDGKISKRNYNKMKKLPPFTEEEKPFEIPETWVWCRLGNICNTITKGSSPKWQGVNYVDSYEKGILFITSKNVDSFRIDLSNSTFVEEKFNEIEPRSKLEKGDILTNIVGASIGRTAIFDLDFTSNINQAVCILRYKHNYFLKDLLLRIMNANFIVQLMLDMQFSPGRANLSMNNLAKFPIANPPLSEQKIIVEKVEKLMALCDDMEKEINQNTEYSGKLMQAVLREAFEGNN